MRIVMLILLSFLTSGAIAASDAEVRTLQQALLDAGYDVGAVDGKAGRRTEAAIRRYQADWELPENAKVSEELISRLTRKHPATRPGTIAIEDQTCRFHNPMPQARETVTYSGSCIDGLAEGSGKTVWRFILNGEWQEETYQGEKAGGQRNGYGLSVWNDGEVYEGGWKDNQRHGAGVSEWPDGNKYYGEWRRNLQHGQGILIWSSEDRYVGEWRDGKRAGNGTYVWSNGDRYDGNFANDKRQGFGVFVSRAGDRYEGQFANDRLNGPVVLTESDGRVYSGEWKDGCFSDGEIRKWLGKTEQACGFDLTDQKTSPAISSRP